MLHRHSRISVPGTLHFVTTVTQIRGYWLTPQAMKNDPDLAQRMNDGPKVVFSRTMNSASWTNTKLVKGTLTDEVRKMKNASGAGLAILGSGTIVSQLAQEGLIDEFQIVVAPVVLGKGRTMFEGIRDRLPLKLTRTQAFNNGNVLLCYAP